MRKKLQLLLTLLLALPIGMQAAGTTWQSATAMALDGSASGSLSADRTEEWYTIKVPSNGELTITTTPSGGLEMQHTVLYALDSGNNLRERGSSWVGKEKNTYTVVSCAAGTYYLKVRRNNAAGNYNVSNSFKATSSSYPNDSEPNDKWEQATKTLTNHVPTTGQLGYFYYNDTDTEDWYKITIPENGTVKVSTTSHIKLDMNYTSLYALDSGNILRERGNVWSGNEKASFLVVDCAKGTYYIRVKRNGAEGAYTLQYDFTPTSIYYADDREPNDSWDQATKMLRNHVEVTGHLGYQYYNDGDKEDWYKLEVPENGTVKVTTSPHINVDVQHLNLDMNYTVLYVLDADNVLRERGSVWPGREGASFLENDCAKGTYYIKVKQNGAEGAYSLRYDFTPTSEEYANDLEPNDDWTQANTLALDGSTTGHLGYVYYNDGDKEDWYKVVIPEDGEMTITTTPHKGLDLQHTILYALDANNILRERGSVWPGKEGASFLVDDCSKGTYYIRVKHNGAEGAYTLRNDFKPISSIHANDSEPNNDWTQAGELKRGATTTGHLGYGYYNDGDKEDWFKINVPRDGTIRISFKPFINLDLYYTSVYALDANNTLRERASLWGGKEGGEIVIPDAKPGTYYVRMKHNTGEGSYTLRYVFEQNSYATDTEPNDTKEQALSLAKGVTVAGHLGYFYYNDRDDDDYYKLTLSAKGTVTVNYQPTGALDLNYVSLYNSEGREKGSIWGAKDAGTLKVENLDAGDYYVRVRRNGGYGTYFLCYGSTIGAVDQQKPMADEDVTDTNEQPGTSWNNGGNVTPNRNTNIHMNADKPQHWYYFNVTQDGQADITLSLRNGLDISGMHLFARSGDNEEKRGFIDLATNETGTLTVKDLAPGKYYIRIDHHSGDGDYTLTTRFTPCTVGNDQESNNTWKQAVQTISPGQTIEGHMGYYYMTDDKDKDDWYKVEVPYDGIVTLTLKPQSELDFYAIDFGFFNTEVNGIERQGNSADESSAGLTVTMKQVNVAAGTYYLHIPYYSGQGGYTLSFEHTPCNYGNDQEPNDTWQQANTELDKGSTLSGHLGYVKYNVTDKNDWYTIDISQKSDIDVTIQLCQELDLYGMKLYRKNGSDLQQVESVDPYFGETKTLSVKDLEAGTYYICVDYCAGQGYYFLSFAQTIGTPDNPQPKDENQGGSVTDEFTAWMTNAAGGGTVTWKLKEKPIVRMTDTQITVTSTRETVTFVTDEVEKFTMNASGRQSVVGIDETEAQPACAASVDRQADVLLFEGCRPGEPVMVYTIGGRLVSQHKIGDDGCLQLSLEQLTQGAYIVKSNSVTIKIVK